MCLFSKDNKDINANDHVPNNGWKNKNITAWTCQELQGWIFHLKHLGIGVQLELMEEIRNAEMSGEDFNSCTTANDITDSFDTITKTTGDKVYKSLEKIRKKYNKNYNNNNNRNNRQYNNYNTERIC